MFEAKLRAACQLCIVAYRWVLVLTRSLLGVQACLPRLLCATPPRRPRSPPGDPHDAPPPQGAHPTPPVPRTPPVPPMTPQRPTPLQTQHSPLRPSQMRPARLVTPSLQPPLWQRPMQPPAPPPLSLPNQALHPRRLQVRGCAPARPPPNRVAGSMATFIRLPRDWLRSGPVLHVPSPVHVARPAVYLNLLVHTRFIIVQHCWLGLCIDSHCGPPNFA